MTASEMDGGEKDFFAARGFGNRIGFGDRPALLVIDFMCGFTSPDYPLGANLDAEIDASRTILDAARRARVPVAYTVVQYDTVDGGFAGVWQRKQHGLASLLAGDKAVEIDGRVAPVTGEPTFAKKYASAFFGTDLLTWLVSRSIDTVVLVGCTTSGCIRATAVDAVQYGLRPMVVAEGVGDRSAPAHRQALFDLDQKYADVVSANEVLGYLEGLGAPGRDRNKSKHDS
ncbi:isochorismatase family protein [Pseudonocardia hispaniensis]|uniref:Isochorismatase family protein n=1 Tax=Pseudonocardia hispaniensis TaxID=904933 RepID=A0ABW1IYX4_9PSEU